MFFHLGPERAEISDASSALIATYKAVRIDPDAILAFLRHLRPDRKSFNRIRRYAPSSKTDAAARFIFLNKACWNGLYRVNSNGIFNVPFGWPKTDFLLDESNFLECSKQLHRRAISIRCQDFEEIAPRVVANDFIFLDPPYVTAHNMNGFVDWNESLFGWDDQIRLAKMAKTLVDLGANVLITNAAHADVKDLYTGFGQMEYERSSTLAANLRYRRRTSEAIFFGGPAYQTSKLRYLKQSRNRHARSEHRRG